MNRKYIAVLVQMETELEQQMFWNGKNLYKIDLSIEMRGGGDQNFSYFSDPNDQNMTLILKIFW